jgi:hypothetical protein
MMIKGDILRMIEEEEQKFKMIAQAKDEEEQLKKVLTYEEYYQA